MFKSLRSLRLRIQLWHAVILATVIVVFGGLMYFQERHRRYQAIDNELAAAVEVIVGKLQAAPPEALRTLRDRDTAVSPSVDEAFQKLMHDLQVPKTFAPRRYQHEFEAPYFAVLNETGQIVFRSTDLIDIGEEPFPQSETHRGAIGFRGRDSFREAFALGPPGTWVRVGRFIEPDQRDLRNTLWLILGSGAVVFAIGILGGWVLSRRSVQPIREISQVADCISHENLADRIDSSTMDHEFQQLATTLNEAFARLQDSFEQQAQFTADASHELRTPLTVMKMHLDLARSKERTAGEYRDVVDTCNRAVARMSSLVESLLTLARMDADDLKLNRQQTELSVEVRSCVDSMKELANAKQIEITLDLADVHAEVDTPRFRQVVSNLLANAVAYSPPSSVVSVSLSAQGSEAVLCVADAGIGIAPEHIASIFDRFYRVDKARSQHEGGSGLGLAICKSVVEAHNGNINVESAVCEGSAFTVRIPLTTPTAHSD